MKPLGNSMTALKFLYAVTAGFALTEGSRLFFVVKNLDGDLGVDFRPGFVEYVIFVIFISTVVRFSHGAMRHFDATYVEPGGHPSDWDPLIDFVGLFAQATLLLLMAFSLDEPRDFSRLLLALIVIDTIWLTFAYRASPDNNGAPFNNWVVTNSLFIPLFPVLILWGDRPEVLVPILATTVIFHTTLDYAAPNQWEFYFPDVERPKQLATFADKIENPWNQSSLWLMDYVNLLGDIVGRIVAIAVEVSGRILIGTLLVFFSAYWVVAKILSGIGLSRIWYKFRNIVSSDTS